MSFINWGSESPEQLRLRRRFEEEQQAIFEQRAAAVAATAAAAAGSGRVSKSTEVLLIDSGFNFYRFSLTTGEYAPLVEANPNPVLLTEINNVTTDPVSGDVWLEAAYNPCFPARCEGSGLIRVSIDGGTLTWHEPIDTLVPSDRRGLAWNKEDSSIIAVSEPNFVPVDINTFELVKLNPVSGESTSINEITCSIDMRITSIISSKRAGWIWLLFSYPEQFSNVRVNRYSLFHVDPYASLAQPLLPEEGLVFTSSQIGRIALDHASDLFVYLTFGRRLDPNRIGSLNKKGETLSDMFPPVSAIAITDIL